MSESKIEWTERTWNPIVGCSILTPGCTNCYAMKMAARLEVMGNVKHYAGTTKKVKGNAVWTGKLALAPDNILLDPLKRKKPTTYFVNSMGDLFHEGCSTFWITKALAVMAMTPHHTYQVLTKRAHIMRAFMSDISRRNEIELAAESLNPSIGKPFSPKYCFPWPLPNVWLGVSTERQQEADERIPHLLQTPAAVRFISAEPLLGPIDLMMLKSDGKVYDALQGCIGTHIGDGEYDGAQPCNKLDWVIVGGESGPNARPMHPDWARSLRDQCEAAGVAYFFKQWGAHEVVIAAEDGFSAYGDDLAMLREAHQDCTVVWPDGRTEQPGSDIEWWNREFDENDDADPVTLTDCAVVMNRVGKKSAGRLLDGIEHNAMPKVTA